MSFYAKCTLKYKYKIAGSANVYAYWIIVLKLWRSNYNKRRNAPLLRAKKYL